jgi:hypothetical protein
LCPDGAIFNSSRAWVVGRIRKLNLTTPGLLA